MQRASPLAREAVLCAGVAASFAAVLAWAGPPGTDLAAHVYQRTVFLDHGFALWNNFWYAGRYSFVTYSLLYYPLAAALGIRLLAVATVAAATLAFAVLVWREWGPSSRWSSRTFAVVWAGIVLSAAFPFALGAALALLALWALQARRPWRFAGVAALSAAASPLAFLFLVLIVVGLAIGRRTDRWLQVAAGTGLLAIVLVEGLLWRIFPGTGRYPFSAPEVAAACVYCALSTVFAWRVPRLRSLRYVFPVYGIACLTFFLVPSAVGENIARLRYAAIPLSVLVLSMRGFRPRVPAIVVLALAVSWNVTPLAASYVKAEDDPAAHAAYWQPAVSFLHAHLTPSYRVEAVDTSGHWAALYLPRADIPLARGWYRQDDFPQNEVLYDHLGPQAYVSWLRHLGVRYVVLTAAGSDYSAHAEAALLRSGRTPLRPVFRTATLTIYALPHPTPLLTGPARARVLLMKETRIARSGRRAGLLPAGGPVLALLASLDGLRGRDPRRDDAPRASAGRHGDARLRPGPEPRAGRADGRCVALVRALSRLAPDAPSRPSGRRLRTRPRRVLRRQDRVPGTADGRGHAADDADRDGQPDRRQAGVRDRRLQGLPHAERGGRDRHGRPEPRPEEAALRPRRRPGHERQGRDAVVQRPAQPAADRRRRRLRRPGDAGLTLPDDFPRGVRAFACDLDRTLIAEDAELRPRTRAAIAAARGAGIHVILATGRMFRSVRPYAREAGIEDPVVCYQGAVVAEPVSGRFLRHEPIPLELAREAIAAVAEEGYPLNCYVGDELYVAEHTSASESYARFQHLEVHAVGDLLDWLREPPTKLVAVGDPVELEGLKERLVERFDGRMYISKSLPYFLELASPNVTKAAGLAFVAEHLGFTAAESVAFGDGENDVELLEWAGYGVAVGNAHERVIAVADLVCPPVQEEGVAQVIEAYLAR